MAGGVVGMSVAAVIDVIVVVIRFHDPVVVEAVAVVLLLIRC